MCHSCIDCEIVQLVSESEINVSTGSSLNHNLYISLVTCNKHLQFYSERNVDKNAKEKAGQTESTVVRRKQRSMNCKHIIKPQTLKDEEKNQNLIIYVFS